MCCACMVTGSEPSWPRVKQILGDALDLPSGHRTAFVQQASEGDQQLEAKVMQMLRGYDTSTLLLDDPTTNVAQALQHAAAQATEELVGASIGRYKLVKLLGRGGMGAVYEAEDAALQRTVAIKLMPGGLGGRSGAKRLEREAKMLARLKHPAIAEVYEAGACSLPTADAALVPQGSTPYIAMEYVPGGRSLNTYVKQEKLSVRDRVLLIAAICDGVQHAHQRGVIHRDLKPDNVLIATDGLPKIIDFGIARVRDESDTSGVPREAVTLPGQLLGTLRYMSPEQASGRPDDVDARADVHALGLMLYELLTGKHALDDAGLSTPQALAAISTQVPAKPSVFEPACKGDLDVVVMKALAKAPADRYQAVSELRSDLLAWTQGLAISAVPPSTLAQVRSFARRNRPLVFAIVGVALAMGTATVVSVVAQQRAEAAKEIAQREARRAQRANSFLQGMITVLDSSVHTNPSANTLNTNWVVGSASASGITSQNRVGMIASAARVARESFQDDPEVLVEVLPVLGRSLTAMESGAVQGASLIREAFEIAERHYGMTHERTLQARAAIGSTTPYEAKSAGIDRAFLERTEQLLTQAYGATDPRTLTARAATANFVWQNGNKDTGEGLYRVILNDVDRYQGKLSPTTIELWALFAANGRNFGPYEIAISAYQEVLERTKASQEPVCKRYRLCALTYLALAANDAGNDELAQSLLEEAELLKSFDPVTFASDAATLAMARGDLVRATIFTREKLAAVQGPIAELSGIGAKTLTTLARMLTWRGEDLVDANVATERAIIAWHNLDVPADYDWYLYSFMVKASILRQTGDLQGAERLLRSILEQRGTTCGWFETPTGFVGDSCSLAHSGPAWLEILVGTELAACLHDQGRLDEARHAIAFARWHAGVGEEFPQQPLTSRGLYLMYWSGVVEGAIAQREHGALRGDIAFARDTQRQEHVRTQPTESTQGEAKGAKEAEQRP